MMIPPVHVPAGQPPSARAVELGEQLEAFVRLARERDPKLGAHEIQQAFGLAQASFARELPFRPRRLVVGLLLAALAFGAWVVWVWFVGRTAETSSFVVLTLISMVVTAVGIAIAVRRDADRGPRE